MKKTLIILSMVLATALFFTTFLAPAKTYAAPRRINSFSDNNNQTVVISGQSEEVITPDMALLNLTVETENEDLATANRENSEKIESLKTILKGYEIEEKDMQTNNFYANKKYEYKNNEQIFTGFQVINNLKVRTSKIDKLSEMIASLIENGANNFSGVSFYASNTEDAYNRALKAAFENAKTKASNLTGKEQGLVAKEIIEENLTHFQNFKSFCFADMETSSILGGEITIKACVKVVFEINSLQETEQNQLNENITQKNQTETENAKENATQNLNNENKNTTDMTNEQVKIKENQREENNENQLRRPFEKADNDLQNRMKTREETKENTNVSENKTDENKENNVDINSEQTNEENAPQIDVTEPNQKALNELANRENNRLNQTENNTANNKEDTNKTNRENNNTNQVNTEKISKTEDINKSNRLSPEENPRYKVKRMPQEI